MNRVLLLLAALLLAGCNSASSIVTGQVRAPYDEDKVVVYMAPPTTKYEVIGLVTAQASGGWTEQGHMDSAVENMKEKAAELGANGIILGGTGTVAGPSMGGYTSSGVAIMVPTNKPTVTGTAIWVEQESANDRATTKPPADLYTGLMKLDDLHKRGLLTDAEFEKQKQKLLMDLSDGSANYTPHAEASPAVGKESDAIFKNGLGLAVSVDATRLLVTGVQTDSASANAGIREGDEIIKYNGMPDDHMESSQLTVVASAINGPLQRRATVSWQTKGSPTKTALLVW